MKTALLTILKYLLVVAATLLMVLLLFGFVFMMGWPWWVGTFLVLCVMGLFVGGLFLKKLLLRRKEQQFVQQVIEQDRAQLEKLTAAEQNQIRELQQKWKEALETLRRSPLKKQGNPLYVLPWYLVMGESGSGKTTAISSARLASPFAEVQHTSGVSGTRNCDWWFFDQAIILDTAGRYALPVDSGRDSEEWQKFLSLLVKYRKKEPIHGLIVTVAADKLLTRPDVLESDGRQLRSRIDELMRVLGIRFPVYLLVTKCDLVHGMTQFCERLPEKSLEQPLGMVNQELSQDIPAFLERFAVTVAERLKYLRLLMLHQPERGPITPGALLFPEEIEGVRRGLESFVMAAFRENRYQETPLLRGIYLTSGKQEGTPYSHFLSALGVTGERDILPGSTRGLFLHDFFERILPRDRGLFAPTSRTRQWQELTRNLGLTSWLLIGVALCGLLSYSFVKNMATIREATSVIARSPQLSGTVTADLAVMERFRQMIVTVEQQNRNWWVPRFGLNESRNVEAHLKADFCGKFQNRFLEAQDREMAAAVASLSAATPDDRAAATIVHLVRRINLLTSRLGGAPPETLRARPLPEYLPASSGVAGSTGKPDQFGLMYVTYLAWRADAADMSREITLLQGWLREAITAKGGNLHWLVDWANRQGGAPAVSMRSFWGGSRPGVADIVIPPVFTRKGRELVVAFEEELIAAHPEPATLENRKAEFMAWYRGSCYAAWQRFAIQFPRGEGRLNGAREWQAMAETMTTDGGPYAVFLARVVAELAPFGMGDGVPLWLQQLFRYQALKTAGPVAGAAAKAAETGSRLAEKVGSLVGKRVEGGAAVEAQGVATRGIQEYLASLAAIAPAAKSRNQAYQMALQVYSEDPAVSKSPFHVASDAVQRITAALGGTSGDDTFAKLLSGPLTFYWTFVLRETACSLQSQWEEKVLQEVQGSSDPQMIQYLLGPDGPVWKFVKGPAGPFLGWTPGRGYYARSAMGGSIAFEPSFTAFLAKGAKARVAAAPVKQSPGVVIKGLPTDANADARIKPQSTRLELLCTSGPQSLENLNFPVSKTFVWTSDSCSDVTFQIDVGEVMLTKKYPGPQGFAAFLRDFPGGRHTFYPHDFPRERGALERMGITYIRVNYQISGGGEIIAQAGSASSLPGQAPRVIAPCWN